MPTVDTNPGVDRREFRLIRRPAEAQAQPQVIRVRGPCQLVLADGHLDAIQLEDRAQPPTALAVLEPIGESRVPLGPQLLMLCPLASERPLVNGIRALRLRMLFERDQVAWPTRSWVLHVTLFRPSPVGPLPAALRDQSCAMCRAPLSDADTVYRCVCGALYHAAAPEASAVSCASLSTDCAVCLRPISLKAGYAFWPEDLNEPSP